MQSTLTNSKTKLKDLVHYRQNTKPREPQTSYYIANLVMIKQNPEI